MKDIIISGKVIGRELAVMSGCLVLAVGINVFAVLFYGRPWTEIFTQIGYVVVVAVVLYCIAAVLRILYFIVKCLIKKILHRRNAAGGSSQAADPLSRNGDSGEK